MALNEENVMSIRSLGMVVVYGVSAVALIGAGRGCPFITEEIEGEWQSVAIWNGYWSHLMNDDGSIDEVGAQYNRLANFMHTETSFNKLHPNGPVLSGFDFKMTSDFDLDPGERNDYYWDSWYSEASFNLSYFGLAKHSVSRECSGADNDKGECVGTVANGRAIALTEQRFPELYKFKGTGTSGEPNDGYLVFLNGFEFNYMDEKRTELRNLSVKVWPCRETISDQGLIKRRVKHVCWETNMRALSRS